jgi:glucose/arabinose dehydrogenase
MELRMHPSRSAVWCSAVVAAVAATGLAAAARQALPIDRIVLPAGFHIEVYATGVPNARSMALSPSGVLYVSTLFAGNVYAVVDAGHDGKADKVYTIASGLTMPNGVAIRDGALYLAEIDKVWRYDDIDRRLADPPKPALEVYARWCAATSRPSGTTAGSSSASGPTACCTCRSARRATPARPTRGTRPSSA